MIELRNISKIYTANYTHLHALQNINLTINQGQIFGIIGPSGAGKSTLIRCVNLLEKPNSGQVIIDNEDITRLQEQQLRTARRKIGMIFQNFNLLNSRTVYQNIAFPLELIKTSAKDLNNKVDSLLELVGLSQFSHKYPYQLSGGQKQRVAIARALISEPKVLLCDEATSALDPETTHSILSLLKEINHNLGVTILLITHEMQVIKEICSHLAIIEHGQIIEQANVLDFFSRPQTKIAKQFVYRATLQTLPENIQQRLFNEPQENSKPLWRISFVGQSAGEPLIAQLSQKFSLSLNILQANIEQISEETIGTMLVEVLGKKEDAILGCQFLKDKNVNVEVIGYVR